MKNSNQEEMVIVTVDTDLNVKVQVKGVKGKGCLALTKDIEESLGTVTKRELTPEYKEETQTQKIVRNVKH